MDPDEAGSTSDSFSYSIPEREMIVPCLEEIPTIRERCEAMGIKFCVSSPKSVGHQILKGPKKYQNTAKRRKVTEYEVETILDVRLDKTLGKDRDERLYLVKWKNWDEISNTWEPLENLTNCDHLLLEFHRKLQRQMLTVSDDDETHQREVESSETFPDLKTGCDIVDVYNVKRKAMLSVLKSWVKLINNQLPEHFLPISAENNVDLTVPPSNFTYIIENKAGEGITIPTDPLLGCECVDSCFANKKNCCVPTHFESTFAYDKSKRLIAEPGMPIYECNWRCKCGPDCFNRVVQHGSKIKLSIFRTYNGCGWGVKTLQDIKKNEFVMEYVGEIITSEEAERRGKVYDEIGRTYLFDLDFNDIDNTYTIDAAEQGNIARFMNHSCDPNLLVYGVWIDTIDPGLPRLAYFSKRYINKGEELTFDYKIPCKSDNEVSSKRILCKCGASKCRKYLS